MDHTNVVNQIKSKLDQSVSRLQDSLKSLRTGRAHASMLDNVVVEAYGAQMPLKQVASITVPEAQLLQITPFDPNNLAAIANSIRNDSNLGLNPSDDGRVIRVPIPALTEERRRDLAKQVGQRQEECMISIRNIRHEAMDVIDKARKDKQIGEDDAKRLSAQVEDRVNGVRQEAEAIAKAKESEILTL
ncbi:MAG TPA: ribosome recycling factor [Candidatus Saccharimonadales bacterium]|nr:ribosome recycling factor [Candidatus Saccharimonadales bacterium]